MEFTVREIVLWGIPMWSVFGNGMRVVGTERWSRGGAETLAASLRRDICIDLIAVAPTPRAMGESVYIYSRRS